MNENRALKEGDYEVDANAQVWRLRGGLSDHVIAEIDCNCPYQFYSFLPDKLRKMCLLIKSEALTCGWNRKFA